MRFQVMNCGKVPIKPDAALLSPWPLTGRILGCPDDFPSFNGHAMSAPCRLH